MSISVTCQNCRKEYRVDDRLGGKKARCKQCGAIMEVPEATAPEAARNDDPFALMEQAEAEKVMRTKFKAYVAEGAPAPKTVPSKPTGTLLPAPPMVGPATPSQPLGYQPRKRVKYASQAPVEGATAWLMLMYLLGLVAALVYMIVAIYMKQMPPGVPEQLVTEYRHRMLGVALTAAGVEAFMYFLLLAPVLMAAVWISGQIMRFGMPDGFYLKCAGLAALPGLMVALVLVLPPAFFLKMLILMAILPVSFYVLMYAFGLDWGEAAVTFALAVMFYVGGQFLNVMVVTFATASAKYQATLALQTAAEEYQGKERQKQLATGFIPPTGAGVSNGTRTSPSIPLDSVGERIRVLRQRIVDLTDTPSFNANTREQLEARAADYRKQATDLKAQRDDATTEELFTLLDEARGKIAAVPSQKPPEEIYADLAPAETWMAADPSDPILGEEVTVLHYKVRPLKETLLDLRSSQKDSQGLVWIANKREGRARMQIAMIPRSNSRQKRPWVASRAFQVKAAEDQKLLAVDGSQANVTTGLLNGMVFTRIASTPGDRPQDRWIKYIALEGENWLVVTLTAGKDDPQFLEMLDTAFHSLRKQRAGEKSVDPFAPERVAQRLADSPDAAATVLRRVGKPAEDAVMPYLKDPNLRVKIAAVGVLGDIGSEKALPAIRELAKDKNKEVRQAARAAWRAIAPKELDSVAEALMDLESASNWIEQREPLEALAQAKPDERREKIAPLLEGIILDERNPFGAKDAGAALEVWYTSKTATHLLPILENPENKKWAPEKLHAAMDVVAATKDPKGVYPIIRWIQLDRAYVVKSLINMGPVAEDETLKLLEGGNPDVRVAACEVLEQIGGQKSLKRLSAYIRDKRDRAFNDAATAAYEAVKARVEARPQEPAPR